MYNNMLSCLQVNVENNTTRSEDQLIKNESAGCPDPNNIQENQNNLTIKGAVRISVHGDHYW